MKLSLRKLTNEVRRFTALPCFAYLLVLVCLAAWSFPAAGQTDSKKDGAKADEGIISGGYNIKQSIEFGGRITDFTGSSQLWNTFVNLHSGPRLLGYDLEMHSLEHNGFLFDELSFHNFGYGGDPNNVSRITASKNKWYSFSGSFRRDKNFWDYNLQANPLNPPTSNPAVAITSSPHSFQTVRRNSDARITLAPSSPIRVRLGFNHNVSEGPTFTSFHEGTDVLLFQNWRNNIFTYQAGVDFKMIPRTTISYDQFIVRQKGDNSQVDQNFGFQLSNGTPADLGLIFNTAANSPCAAPISNATTNPPTINPTCNAYLAYNRSGRVRGTLPTEQLSFSSNYFKKLDLTGRLSYSSSHTGVNDFQEFFQGLVSRNRAREFQVDGPTSSTRITVSTDLGLTWRITDKLRFLETFRWTDFRIPTRFDQSESTLFAATLLSTPNVFNPATCPPPFTAATCPQHIASSPADLIVENFNRYLGQDSKLNTVELEYDIHRNLGVRLGYRIRNRFITHRVEDSADLIFFPTLPNRGACAGVALAPDGTCRTTTSESEDDIFEINEHSLLFGISTRFQQKFRANFDLELMSADNIFTRINPRQMQHYKVRTSYKPYDWLNLGMSVNILENRNNVTEINNLQHSRNYGFTAGIAKSENWGVDLSYGYNDIFSQTNICFVETPAPAGAFKCGATTFLEDISIYSSATHFGSINLMWKPIRQLTATAGYDVNSVNGNTLILNPISPIGPLSFNYHLPYASLALDTGNHITWKGGWNHYGYNERSDPGFTAPRDFRGNVFTISAKYKF